MGLDINGTKFLLYAKSLGVSFARTAMIGRQGLLLNPDSLQKNLRDFGYSLTLPEVEQLFTESHRYAEPLLKLLGAGEISSFDASDFEGATYIADFNEPVLPSFQNKFSVVLDGGTLEHVFNFPVAIKNCMEMVQPGGHFLGITPANNFFGHGFYQFSPELFFRIFQPINGFKLLQLIALEDSPVSEWFAVADPDQVKKRVTLVNTSPSYLLIIAQKVASIPIFAAPTQQSDYTAGWEAKAARKRSSPPLATVMNSEGRIPPALRALYDLAPNVLKTLYRRVRYSPRRGRRYRVAYYNPQFFRRISVP